MRAQITQSGRRVRGPVRAAQSGPESMGTPCAQAGTRDTLTRSEYFDTGVIGSLGLLALALLRGHNSHIVHSVGVLVVVVFGITLAATLSGAVMQVK